MTDGPRAYVTYFDQRYLALAAVMLRSVRRYDPGALLFALCFDAPSFAAIRRLNDPAICALRHEEVLAFEPRLAACGGRARNAFYATHKPVLPLLALSRRPDVSAILHVDADCCFRSSPQALFEEIGGASIALSPHDFSPVFAELDPCGRFNAGFIYWRHDATGVRCLEEYREDCLDWCEPRVEPDGRFMNQGYLVRWPERYDGVHVIRHPGVNLAYWNMAHRSLSGVWRVLVNGEPLICYHFSGLFRDAQGTWRNARREFGRNLAFAIERIYEPFLADVEEADRRLRHDDPAIAALETGWLDVGEPVGLVRRTGRYR